LGFFYIGSLDTQSALNLDKAIEQFINRLADTPQSPDCSPSRDRLSFGGVMVYTALLVFHQFGTDAPSGQKCALASHKLVQDVSALTDEQYDELPMGMGVR
jgi:hypothetical protein